MGRSFFIMWMHKKLVTCLCVHPELFNTALITLISLTPQTGSQTESVVRQRFLGNALFVAISNRHLLNGRHEWNYYSIKGKKWHVTAVHLSQ